MQAIKIRSVVPSNRQITLPAEVPEGEAEPIILFPGSEHTAGSLADFLEGLDQNDRPGRTNEEIDRGLEVERENWD